MSIQELLEYDLGKLKTITVDEIIIVNDPIQPRNGITLAYFNANVPSGGGNMNFLESGTAIIGQHYKSAGTSGDDCVKSSMLEDSVSITFGGLDLSLIGTMTADTIVKTGGLSTQYLMADGSITTGGSGSSTLANAGAGQTLVSNGVPPSLSTKSLTAGTGITLTPTATNITISASGAGTGINYVGSGTTPGQHYIASSTTGLSANNSALVEDAEKINFNGERIYMSNPTTFSGANYMLKMRGISNLSYEQYGLHIEGMAAAGSAYAIYAQQIDGDSTIGMFLDDIHAKNDCTGIYYQIIRSDVAQATGIYFQSILGETDCQGLQMTTITSNTGNSYGIRMDTIASPNVNAYGISLNGLQANNESYGLIMDDVRAKQNAFGFKVSRVFSDTQQAIGGYITEVGADLNDTFGLVVSTVGNSTSGGKSGNGVAISKIVSGVDATDEACAVRIQDVNGSVGYGVKATGIVSGQQSYFTHSIAMSAKSIFGHWLDDLTGDIEANGTFFQKLQANGTVAAHYFEYLTSQDKCYGVRGQEIQGKVEASGLHLITVNSDSGKSYGTSIQEITASSDAFGHYATQIQSNASSAHGIRVDGIQGAINAEAFATKGVNAKNGLAFGARIESVYTDGKEAYGVYVDGVNAPVGNAYGVLLQNIAGSRQYGFYQRGALNVGNIFDSFVDCGGSTAITDNPVLNVRGSINTKTQFFTTASATATLNGGNIIICSGGTITTLKLPASPPDGLSYQLWKPSTLPLTIDGGAILINGSATQVIVGGSPANPQNASITYSVNLGQWLFHVN